MLKTVGECHCHGLMEGEVIHESQNGHVNLKTLTIM